LKLTDPIFNFNYYDIYKELIKINCKSRKLPEPNYKPSSQVDYICWRRVSLGDASVWKKFADKIIDDNVWRGLTFRESDEHKVHTYVTDFSPKAYRQAYIKALFFEDKRWIRHFESQHKGKPVYDLVGCRRRLSTGEYHMNQNCINKNLELRVELRDQVHNNLEYRKGYFEAIQDGKPTTKFNKYLHQDVRRFIQKYNRYQNHTEVFHGENRRLCDGGIFGEVVQYEQGSDRDITEPKEPSIRETLPEEAIILR